LCLKREEGQGLFASNADNFILYGESSLLMMLADFSSECSEAAHNPVQIQQS